jgi:hypothetical protein
MKRAQPALALALETLSHERAARLGQHTLGAPVGTCGPALTPTTRTPRPAAASIRPPFAGPLTRFVGAATLPPLPITSTITPLRRAAIRVTAGSTS